MEKGVCCWSVLSGFEGVIYAWRASNAVVLGDWKADDCVMDKMQNECGLVGSSYRFHVPCSRVDTRARLPASRGDPLLAESRCSRTQVSRMIKESRNGKTLPRTIACGDTCIQVPTKVKPHR